MRAPSGAAHYSGGTSPRLDPEYTAVPPLTALERTIATTTHGRYLVRPADSTPPAGLIVGFHGYAQDAEALLQEIEAIPGSRAWIAVSVQALHRFYNRVGEIVASWMTSQDRESAIADNLAYVQTVTTAVRGEHGLDTGATALPMVFVGFSQGVAMAMRAAANLTPCAGVIALGGDVPPEIRASATQLSPVLLGRGLADEWYTREKLDVDRAWFTSAGIDARVVEFDGGHAWTDAFRTEAGHFLARLAPKG